VVDVTHDGDHRGTRETIGLVLLRELRVEVDVELLEQLALLVLRGDDLDLVAELVAEQLRGSGGSASSTATDDVRHPASPHPDPGAVHRHGRHPDEACRRDRPGRRADAGPDARYPTRTGCWPRAGRVHRASDPASPRTADRDGPAWPAGHHDGRRSACAVRRAGSSPPASGNGPRASRRTTGSAARPGWAGRSNPHPASRRAGRDGPAGPAGASAPGRPHPASGRACDPHPGPASSPAGGGVLLRRGTRGRSRLHRRLTGRLSAQVRLRHSGTLRRGIHAEVLPQSSSRPAAPPWKTPT
jgi:hypothetical protein